MPPAAITCLMTCYNESRFIEAAIRSVQGQTRSDAIAEILVINDGSTDGSAALLDAIARENEKIRVFHLRNGGISAARNFGLQQVRTPFVAILDGDDLWHPGKMERQLAAIERSDPRVALWYSDFCDFFSSPSDGTLIPVQAYHGDNDDVLREFFVHDAPIVPSTVILRTAVIHELGGFDQHIKLFEDMDMWLRIAASGHRFQHVDGAITFKRNHPGGLSRNTDKWEGAFGDIGAAWAEKHPELAPLLPRRTSYRLAKIAQQYFLADEGGNGWRFLWRAFKANPMNRRVPAYAFFAFFPYRTRMRLTGFVKRQRGRLHRPG